MRHRKSWLRSSSVGALNEVIRTPWGSTRPDGVAQDAALAGGVHALQHQQHRAGAAGLALGEQPLLQVGQLVAQRGEVGLARRLVAVVARGGVGLDRGRGRPVRGRGAGASAMLLMADTLVTCRAPRQPDHPARRTVQPTPTVSTTAPSPKSAGPRRTHWSTSRLEAGLSSARTRARGLPAGAASATARRTQRPAGAACRRRDPRQAGRRSGSRRRSRRDRAPAAA